jgi:beta-carotene 3-hydroxylase
MNTWLFNSLTVLAAFVSMECIAWLAHKYIMHGIGWFLHSDHHHKQSDGFFERNDFFFLLFAIPGIVCLAAGLKPQFAFLFWIGLGITLYGFAYFLIHEVFIHRRFRIFRNLDSFYLRALRKAHKMHHKHLQKQHGESFGMLWVSLKYFKEALKSNVK